MDALSRQPPRGTVRGARKQAGRGALGLASAMVVLAFATGSYWLIGPALALAVASGILLSSGMCEALLANLPAGMGPPGPHRHGGGCAGWSGGGARCHRGDGSQHRGRCGDQARSRDPDGAAVKAGAIVEENAVVSWGASVGKGAVVEREATVGAGAAEKRDARLPQGMCLSPGAVWRATSAPATPGDPPSVPAPAIGSTAADPRLARIDTACGRIERALQGSSAELQAYLGESARALPTLKETCHRLVVREQRLREESSSEARAWLDQERAGLERRILETSDDAIRRSLEGAVAAIVDQQHQRELLGKSADRIEAELTRMLWTLEGMEAQLVRLRTVGLGTREGVDVETAAGVQRLQAEIGALADALDELSGGGVQAPSSTSVAEIESGPEPQPARGRERA